MTRPIDEILLQKTAAIRRCVERARQERSAAGSNFRIDFTRMSLEG